MPADYAIVSLLDVEDSVGGRVQGLEGRFGRKHLGSSELGISRFTYGPNVRNPSAHSHREQEEAYVVVGGSGRIRLDDEIRDVRQWDVIRVAPEVVRAFEAGPTGSTSSPWAAASRRAATASSRTGRGLTRPTEGARGPAPSGSAGS